MLHALIHRKLDPLRPDAHRLEDALTSTVFTTLAHAGATAELVQWFGVAENIRGSNSALDPSLDGLWFWPRLAHAEPDLIIRLGPTLLLVEAKLRSGRHDRTEDESDEGAAIESDQIRRQWQCLSDPHSARFPALERALIECSPTLIYIVDAPRLGRARRELAESVAGLPPDADVRLLTWQQLYGQLHRAISRPAWVADLMAAMDIFGVGGFVGFTDVEMTGSELEAVRGVTLAKFSSSPWQWNTPVLADARRGLAALAPFLLRWAASDQSSKGASS